MLNKLLATLFGKQDPHKMISQTLMSDWQEWLKPISESSPTGDDPTYHDDFQLLKEEVNKLSGMDYDFIISTSETILKQNSKDIRVATYYCWARLQQDGAQGFADGLTLLAGLIERFGGDIYPSRHNIRKNAIEWLASAKFTESISRLTTIDKTILEQVIAALTLIEQAGRPLFNENEQPNLDTLLLLFSTSLSAPTPMLVAEAQSSSSQSSLAQMYSTSTSNDLKSNRDVLDQARRIAAFLRDKPEGYLAAGRFLRALRWDTVLSLPPSDQKNWTRLPAPRAELKQNLNRLVLQQQWTELFERVESAFMESANHFWLDLQRYTVLALQKMGYPYQEWADIYLTDIALMLGRLKGLERLAFDNGFPFADDETLHWIASEATIHQLDENSTLAPIPVAGEDDWHEMEQQAIEQANNEGLEVAFSWLQSLPNLTSAKQQYLLKYTQARVAESVNQKEIALKLLTQINEQQQMISLQAWEPGLLFDIKEQMLRLLKYKLQLKESDKGPITQQIEQIGNELMQIDPARAVVLTLAQTKA